MSNSEFSLADTLESGQIFRYKYVEGGALVAHGQDVFLVREDGTSDHPDQEWYRRFVRADQPALTHEHPAVQEAIEGAKGVRILRQDPWECLVAFIISQNNHQKRIQQNVTALARTYGKHVRGGMHAFPQPHELGDEQELRELGLGYRARYVAALRTADADRIAHLADLPYDEAKKQLMTLEGVGPKVADCIALFALGFDQACPEDTWIKKVFSRSGLTREQLGQKAGLLQQMLFHYARSGGYRS